ncbi:neprosin family prolyl endopeptidase [Kitasatospora sp. NPDC098652]|uniref:neprosin family prolyl endopeptidase n=1 Tax=Kitasatospora sp. NPDC098652 TaxID=3364095 RepID=UPI00382946D0
MLLSRRTIRPRPRTTAAALTAATIAATILLPATTAHAAQCWFGACFSYVTGRQQTTTAGAAVTMYVADPTGVPANGHSLQELSLQSTGGTVSGNTVEIGWTVDPQVNGDYLPHLFVFHWINGQPTSYNTGFVPTSSTVRPGMALPPGGSVRLAWWNSNGNWWAYYDNTPIGYFPGSTWSGTFTTAQIVSAFGEVAADSQTSCTQMGDGLYGSQAGSSSISDYQLYGSSDQPRFTVSATDPSYYNYGAASATSFRLGGPGAC